MDLRRHPVQVPARLPVFVGNDAGAAQLRFFLAGDLQHFLVVGHETGTGVDFAGHQSLAHEDVMRFARCDATVVHRLFRRQHQAEQADLLGRQHLALRARPVRVEVLAQQQVR